MFKTKGLGLMSYLSVIFFLLQKTLKTPWTEREEDQRLDTGGVLEKGPEVCLSPG